MECRSRRSAKNQTERSGLRGSRAKIMVRFNFLMEIHRTGVISPEQKNFAIISPELYAPIKRNGLGKPSETEEIPNPLNRNTRLIFLT